MPAMVMEHQVDPRDAKLAEIGDVSKFEVFNNQVLCAVYLRPQKTRSGIYLTDNTTDEDRHQSKVGLVIKMGPDAFQDTDGKWFRDLTINVHDWLVFRPSDGWGITVNGVLCRHLEDAHIVARIPSPDMIY